MTNFLLYGKLIHSIKGPYQIIKTIRRQKGDLQMYTTIDEALKIYKAELKKYRKEYGKQLATLQTKYKSLGFKSSHAKKTAKIIRDGARLDSMRYALGITDEEYAQLELEVDAEL